MLGGSAVHFSLAASFFSDGPRGRARGGRLRRRGAERAPRPRRGHLGHRARRGRQDLLLGRRVRVRPQHGEDARHPAQRVRRVPAQALRGLTRRRAPVPRQHPARPPARGARAVHRSPAGGPRLDELLDRERPRRARAHDRRGGHPVHERRRAAHAHRAAQPRARGAHGDGDGPARDRGQAGRVRRGAVHRGRLLRPPGLPARDRGRPHGRGRLVRRRLPRLPRLRRALARRGARCAAP